MLKIFFKTTKCETSLCLLIKGHDGYSTNRGAGPQRAHLMARHPAY